MWKTLVIVLLIGSAVGLRPPVSTLPASTDSSGFGSNPGNLLMFRHVPAGLPANRPVVVAMHGCTQNATGYGTGAGWVELADRLGFTVVLPEQQTTNNLNRCFNWFEPADTTRGQGEVESTAQMVRQTIADTGADPRRVYVTGLSAGGAMTAAMLATYPELFAGGGVVAGVAYRCATTVAQAFSCMNPGVDRTPQQLGDAVRAASQHTGPWPSVSVWHGSADFTVRPVNQTELVEQWTNVGAAVESRTITGMGHGQPVDPGTGPTQCGQAGAFLLDVDICAAWHLAETWRLAELV